MTFVDLVEADLSNVQGSLCGKLTVRVNIPIQGREEPLVETYCKEWDDTNPFCFLKDFSFAYNNETLFVWKNPASDASFFDAKVKDLPKITWDGVDPKVAEVYQQIAAFLVGSAALFFRKEESL